MRPIAVVLVVVAMVFAGMTAFVAKRWLDVQSSRKPAEVTAMSDVLVVARDVAAGLPIADEDLRYDAWPASTVSDRFVMRKPGEDPKAKFIGQVARRPLTEGEPFAPASSFKLEGAGVLAGVLKTGMRAVSVSITNASAVSGFVAPGDRVDVVMAADFQRADSDATGKGGGGIVRYAAETILDDVKVLAIDQQMAKGKDGAAIVGKTATLEVTPKQAEVLTAAGMVGQLSLVLRGLNAEPVDPAVPGPPARIPFTSDTEASKAMQSLMGGGAKPKSAARSGGGVVINRAGDISNKSF